MVFLSSSAYYAQQITIFDSKTNEPISGVSVFNASKTVFKISDHDGKVSLEYFSGGDDIIFKNLLYVRKRLPFKEIKNKKHLFKATYSRSKRSHCFCFQVPTKSTRSTTKGFAN